MTKAKIEVLKPKEVPLYRFSHPYGSINVYAKDAQITKERVLLLLEQAKFDLLRNT